MLNWKGYEIRPSSHPVWYYLIVLYFKYLYNLTTLCTRGGVSVTQDNDEHSHRNGNTGSLLYCYGIRLAVIQ
jgi:hypothetical protein